MRGFWPRVGACLLAFALSIAACRSDESQPTPTPTEPPAPPTEPAPTVAPEPPTAVPEPTPAPVEPQAVLDGGGLDELELIGIVRGGAGGASALIGFAGRQEIFRKGDAVFDFGTVKEVRVDSVVIHSRGRDATLRLAREVPIEAPPPAAAGDVAVPALREAAPIPISEPLSRSETRSAIKEFSTILAKADARRVPVERGYGVELGNVGASSFLAKLGLRSGDVLQKLNGITIDDPDDLPDLSSTADGKELAVSFSRSEVGLTVSRRLQ